MVVPAYAGVIQSPSSHMSLASSCPRVCGGDPDSEYIRALSDFMEQQDIITKKIRSLPDPYANILIVMYISKDVWGLRDAAKIIGYEYSYTARLHREALEQYGHKYF